MNFESMCSASDKNDSIRNYDEESLEYAAPSTNARTAHGTLFDASRAKVQAMIMASRRVMDTNKSNKKEADMTDSDTDEDNDKEQQQQQQQQEQQKDKQQTWNTDTRIIIISGIEVEDAQTSATTVSNVSSFSLPDPNGRAGGACTSALLQGTYTTVHTKKYYWCRNDQGYHIIQILQPISLFVLSHVCAVLYSINDAMSFIRVLQKMKRVLSNSGYTQIPQLSSNRPLDLDQDFYIVPPDCQGTLRAVLIGINYQKDQQGQLTSCHNDCLNMKDYLIEELGFEEENIVILMDDGNHVAPTRSNILDAYQSVVAQSKEGDVVFCHYSGEYL
jgi:hypothetical protein